MPELEQRLRTLGGDESWPSTPDIASAVERRVDRAPAGRAAAARRRPRRLVVAVTVAVLVLPAAALAVPPVRDEVLDWLGIGGVEVRRSPEPAAGSFPELRDLGRPVTLGEAGTALGRRVALPAALGQPDEIRARAGVVSLLYAPRNGLPRILLAEIPGDLDENLVRKTVDVGTEVRPVKVRGARGVFLGGRHTVLYVRPDGDVAESVPRLAGRALVWSRDGVVFRLEADVPLRRAIRIARSVR